ncbi:MAG: hypothetical protein ACLGIR_00335 [Actinomycetes bacterium]
MNVTRRHLVAAAAAAALSTISAPAAAHTHQVCTPGNGDPLIQPEPYHGSMPGESGGTRQDVGSNPNHGSRGFHPIHESLHLSNAAGQRAITVVVSGTAVCP